MKKIFPSLGKYLQLKQRTLINVRILTTFDPKQKREGKPSPFNKYETEIRSRIWSVFTVFLFSYRFNILIHSEEIGWIVLILYCNKPAIIIAISCFHALFPFIHHKIHICASC